MVPNIRITILCLIAAGTVGCSLFSGKTSEVVFAPTEVGAPEGDKVTKDIGPAGGTLASPDGRLTLTVPQNAVTETLAFSIQPITNKAANGLGLAYRLEPNGKAFAIPLEVSFRYDDNDLEGTIPEALAIAYQDERGAWHAQKTGRLDQTAKTHTISTTHFTDWAFLARLTLTPTNATLRPGERQVITAQLCEEPGFIDKVLSRPGSCKTFHDWLEVWTLRGPGSVEESGEGSAIYTAPGKRPNPNTAWVIYTVDFHGWGDKTQSETTVRHQLNAKITIIDRGYRASGQISDMTYSGLICDLSKPFTIDGSILGSINYKFSFMPLSAGAGAYTMTGGGTLGAGSFPGESGGTYTIEGADTDKPRIASTGSSSGTGTAYGRTAFGTGSGTGYFDLIPLEGDECSGG